MSDIAPADAAQSEQSAQRAKRRWTSPEVIVATSVSETAGKPFSPGETTLFGFGPGS